jgi:UDP-N-acetylmuramoyl-L-alanyl-D-glutamate--2,6-diaminopimelate ligase
VGTVEIDDGETVVPAEMTTPGVVELVELFGRMRANGVTHCVMEVSSHSLHQHRVGGIEFAVGIFTNLTGDHLDYHGTMEAYAEAKGMLFAGLKPEATAILNTDDAFCARMERGCKAKIVHYGTAFSDRNFASKYAGFISGMSAERLRLRITPCGGASFDLVSPLIGKHNAYNLISVVAACEALGIDRSTIVSTLEKSRGAPGRLQRVESADAGFQVFVDYAHTHDSLENVLKAVRGTMGKGRLICVFGCGGDRDRTKRPKMGAVAEGLADRVIVTSDNPRTENADGIIGEICAGFSAGWEKGGKITVEADRRAAIRAAIGMAEAGDVVLIAGKGHENYQIIGTTKHHFDDVEEAEAALSERLQIRKQ